MKKCASQTSIDTHPVPATEANQERVEIITTPYTLNSKLNSAIFADSSGAKGFTLGRRGKNHRPGWSL
jgi:hypothetical protein